jgi:hypothetical protein
LILHNFFVASGYYLLRPKNMDQQSSEQPPARPNNCLVWSILSTLFCCLPFGIPAIVFACQVDGKFAQGDYEGAAASAKKAKTWCWIAFGSGLALILIYFLFMGTIFATLGMGAMEGMDNLENIDPNSY